MDDSTLKSLAVTATGSKESSVVSLEPAFNRSIKSYSCTVGSDVAAIRVRAVVNEADSFFQVAKADGEGVVHVREGINDIELKVDAHDGSSSVYIISLLRPPAADATLRSLTFSSGLLRPDFHRAETRYLLQLADPLLRTLECSAPPLDSCARVTVSSPHSETKAGGSGGDATVGLYLGDSPVEITITASNGAANQKVFVTARREKPPVYPKPSDSADLDLVCSVCTCTVFRPRKHIPGENSGCAHHFCLTCLDLLTDSSSAAAAHDAAGTHVEPTTATCPLCPTGAAQWGNNPLLDPDPAAETRIAALRVACPFERFGCKMTSIEARVVADHLAACAFAPSRCDECKRGCIARSELEGGRHKIPCTVACDCGVKIRTDESAFHALGCPLAHPAPAVADTTAAVVASTWESDLVDKKLLSTSSVADCIAAAEARKALYAKSLAEAQSLAADTFGQSTARPDTQPLLEAAGLYATAIAINAAGGKVNDPSLHLSLGLALEEASLCNKHFPAAQASRADRSSQPDLNAAAAESFMMDEVNGLLDSLGVPKSASDAVKIREIEGEYTRLNALALSDEAAEVMGLHAFLVKKVAAASGTGGWNDEAGGGGGGGLDGNTDLNTAHAVEKYRAAVRLDPMSPEANFYLGRQLLITGQTDEALQCVRKAVGLKPLWEPARTMLGLALANTYKAETPIPAFAECIHYLSEALDEHRLSPSRLSSETPSFLTTLDVHPHIATLHLTLARAQRLTGHPVAATETLTTLLSILPDILRATPARAPHAATLAAALAETLAALLRVLGPQTNTTAAPFRHRHNLLTTCLLPTARCLAERFSITDAAAGPTASALAAATTQLNIVRALVWASPRNPTALSALGAAQLDMFDARTRRGGPHAESAAALLLDEAEQSFCAAIEAEAGGEFGVRVPPGQVASQAWWGAWRDEDAVVKAKVATAAAAAAAVKKEAKPATGAGNASKAPVRKAPSGASSAAAAPAPKPVAGVRAGPVGNKAAAPAGKSPAAAVTKTPALATAAKASSTEKLQAKAASSTAVAAAGKATRSAATKPTADSKPPIKPLAMARKPVLPAIKPGK
ncbi:hypothetical protein HDU87_001630 [Geranomyces variabilis]|uniref:RING-type domain-containing protein n=1 Tax=Geranomyces variabilis TaxID=109894 RepID=A0AAD5XRX2_9FUNG|nr:hypothetical protein HDU87_001630 [Geranomyces variabilis]